jgi:predicted ATPase
MSVASDASDLRSETRVDAPMTAAPQRTTGIRTPDQRVRVFISSTLGELADERAAVSRAVSAMRLTPVMFELGARPHPPQELYRAYLAQSDIFIGLYWQRYGWIGPGMDISGLEDEFELSRSLPRLLYVKTPAPDRERRLTELLDRIKNEGAESYRTFGTARELGRLVRDDLAAILSERFGAAGAAVPRSSGRDRTPRASLPVDTTSLIGRSEAIEDVVGVIERASARLVTLTGPGGIGKTRLAVAVGERLADRYPLRTAFVPLAAVAEPELVLASIARAVGADMTGTQSPLNALVEHFGDAPFLLVLDNLERLVGAAPDLEELLAGCPGIKILATSRTVLGLRAEHEYPVPALWVPSDPGGEQLAELASSPAIHLFVDRARAVRSDFALTAENASAVAEICRRLEGLPLAIELAAARTRLLDPKTLLARLEASLDALGTGAVDLPERQRTLRATVDWSVGLLDDTEQAMLSTLAVFVDGWTIEAATRVAEQSEDRTLDLLEALARHSLVHVDATGREPWFRMLETVREFVAARAATHADLADLQRRHANYFRELGERADRPLRSPAQPEWTERLGNDAANLGAAVRWFLAHDRDSLPHLFRALWLFWALRDYIFEVRSWIGELMPHVDTLADHAQAELFWSASATATDVGDDAAALDYTRRLESSMAAVDDRYLEGVSHLAMAWTLPIEGDFEGALREALLCLEYLRDQDEPFWTAVATAAAGELELAMGRLDDALRDLTRARELTEQFDNTWLSVSWALLGTVAVLQGRLDDARALLDESLARSLEAESTLGVTLCLSQFAHLALAEGAPDRAAAVLGAAEGLRRRAGMRLWPTLRRREAELVEQLKHDLGADRFEQVFESGFRVNKREAVSIVRGERDLGASVS